MAKGEAAKEIASHAGTQFDPKVVDAFLELVRAKKLNSLVKEMTSNGHKAGGK